MNVVKLYILLHLKYAGIEYAKMISKISGLPLENVNNAIEELKNEGMIERSEGKAIKRKDARFKKAKEVHRHHSYYKLTEKGKLMLRGIDEKWLTEYFNSIKIDNKKFSKALKFFIEKHIGKPFKMLVH